MNVLLMLVVGLLSTICYADQWPVTPSTISTPNQNATNATVAVNASGRIVAVWLENGVVKSTAANVSEGWTGPIQTVSDSGASFPEVVIDSNGTTTALWIQNGIIYTSSALLNENWSTPIALSGSNASSAKLAIDALGNIVAVWEAGGSIQSTTKLVGEPWPITPDTLSSQTGASFPQVAIGLDSNATVLVIWQAPLNGISTIYATSKPLSGGWGTTQTVSASNVNSSYPQIAVDQAGNGVAAWFSYTQVGSVYSNVVVQTSTLSSNQPWTQPITISSSGIRNPADLALSLVAGPKGSALAVWTNSPDGALFHCIYSGLSKGSWSPPILLIGPNLCTYSLDLAIAAKGTAYLVLMLCDNTSFSPMIQGGVNDLSSVSPMFFFPWTLSNGPSNAYPTAAVASNSSSIYAASVWVNFNGINNEIQALCSNFAFPAPPSNLSIITQTNSLGVISEIQNVLSWNPSTSQGFLNYLIFRNGLQIGVVSSIDPLQYIDPNRTVGETVTYGVATYDSTGCQSETVTLVFTN